MSGDRDSIEKRLRQRLQHAVEDVEPAPDALPRVLSKTRRRHRGRRVPAVSLAAAFAVACGVGVLALVGLPGTPGGGEQVGSGDTRPVSVRPDSYVAAVNSGKIGTFDLASGRLNGALADFADARPRAVVGSGERVYALLGAGDSGAARSVVAIDAGGGRRTVTDLPATADTSMLAANGGRVAYVDRGPGQDTLVVVGESARRELAVPDGVDVRDVALDSDGRLAVLVGEPGTKRARVRVLGPGADAMEDAAPLPGLSAMRCGPLAVSWSHGQVAVLQPVACGSPKLRVTTVDASDGQVSGAGVPFRADLRGPREPQLSADQLGRFLVSTGQRQWLVDDSMVRPLPAARVGDHDVPATLWG